MHSKRSLILALALACAGVLSGCPTGGGGSLTLEQLPTEIAEATCSYSDRCLGGSLGRAIVGFDGGDCTTTYAAFANEQFVAQLRAAVAAGTVGFDGARASACIAALDAQSCDMPFGSAPPDCAATFIGLVADGQACNLEQECGATSTCSFGAAGTCPRGTCRHIGQLGEACPGAGGAGCDGDLHCAAGACTAGLPVGSVCTGVGSECAAGLTCSSTRPGMDGTCDTLPRDVPEGGSCLGGTCASGLVCISPGVCAAALTDGTCRVAFGSGSDCPAGEVCTGAMSATPGTCEPAPSEGQPCSGLCAVGTRCASSAAGSTCVRVHHVGEACASDSACYSGYCNGGTCAAAPLCRT